MHLPSRRFATLSFAGAVFCLATALGLAQLADHAIAAEGPFRAEKNAAGQIELWDGQQPVLRYNYQSVAPPEGFLEKVSAGNRQYARARSNYIHPLYGMDGEALTFDWSKDHPHHRGIYWAWPEVDYKGQRGDLHALQRVFARPTGQVRCRGEADRAEIEAENRWMWEDKTPIVHEKAEIRVLRAGGDGRYLDLRFTFTALDSEVAIARRGTTAYGGLNLRMSSVKPLELIKHTDAAGSKLRRAWGDALGLREGGKGPSGLAILQSAANPGYPDAWVDFPYLPWLQPAFPQAGTRYVLEKGKPLVLQYRLWVHRGGKASEAAYGEQWKAYNRPGSIQ